MSFLNHFSIGSTAVSCRKCHPISLSQIWKSGSSYCVRRLYKVTIYTKECGLGQTGPSLHTGDAQLSSLLTFGPARAVLGLKLLLLATLTVQCLVDQTTQKGTVSSKWEKELPVKSQPVPWHPSPRLPTLFHEGQWFTPVALSVPPPAKLYGQITGWVVIHNGL